MVLWWHTRPSRTNTKKRCPLNHRGLGCKSRKSGDTWSNRLVWPWSTNEAGQRLTALPREHTGHSKHPLPTRDDTWTSPDSQYLNQTDYILCSQRWRNSIQSAKTRPGADCGSDHEFLITKFILKLKKVGKTTRPFKYDLNQIPYDYAVEVRNRLKGLDLIEYMMNYGRRFVTLYRRQGSRASPRKRNQKSKMAVWGGLTNSCEKKRQEKQRTKGKINSSVINAKK